MEIDLELYNVQNIFIWKKSGMIKSMNICCSRRWWQADQSGNGSFPSWWWNMF